MQTLSSPSAGCSPSPQHGFERGHDLSIDYGETSSEIFNNGHIIEVETQGENVLTLRGIPYQLKQFHFHTPSEHRVNRRGYDMELHLVHAGARRLECSHRHLSQARHEQRRARPIFSALPDTLNVHEPLDQPFNPKNFLPRSREHYRYAGSLTTPPCTKGVRWIVMSQPILRRSPKRVRLYSAG